MLCVRTPRLTTPDAVPSTARLQRRRQNDELEFNHTSAKARLRDAQKRLKRLVDAFAVVAAAVPGLSCPEHMHERYMDVTNQVREAVQHMRRVPQASADTVTTRLVACVCGCGGGGAASDHGPDSTGGAIAGGGGGDAGCRAAGSTCCDH